jgi:hypothetical protein
VVHVAVFVFVLKVVFAVIVRTAVSITVLVIVIFLNAVAANMMLNVSTFKLGRFATL